MKSLGLVEQDIIALIKWKKATEQERENMVCNQLSLLESTITHEFWWKMPSVNKELYWELQYLYLDHDFFRNKIFKLRAIDAFKKREFKKIFLILIDWATWGNTVRTNYHLHVSLPYKIRTNSV